MEFTAFQREESSIFGGGGGLLEAEAGVGRAVQPVDHSFAALRRVEARPLLRLGLQQSQVVESGRGSGGVPVRSVLGPGAALSGLLVRALAGAGRQVLHGAVALGGRLLGEGGGHGGHRGRGGEGLGAVAAPALGVGADHFGRAVGVRGRTQEEDPHVDLVLRGRGR